MSTAADNSGAFAEVARQLALEPDVDAVLNLIVALAVAQVPGADCASVTLVERNSTFRTVSPTHELCRRVDEVQYSCSEGPCLDATWVDEVVRVDDLATTDRWPTFAPRALELGVASMLCFRLYIDPDNSIGALNLFGRRSGGFDDRSETVGRVFAAHAAIAYEHARERDGLAAAMVTRTLIGQAQGILMSQHKITPETAFDVLVRASQRRNTKLRAIAQELVDTGLIARV